MILTQIHKPVGTRVFPGMYPHSPLIPVVSAGRRILVISLRIRRFVQSQIISGILCILQNKIVKLHVPASFRCVDRDGQFLDRGWNLEFIGVLQRCDVKCLLVSAAADLYQGTSRTVCLEGFQCLIGRKGDFIYGTLTVPIQFF